ncbi:MAG TPA: HAD family hydrolase [Acidimicrobiales bacterium]|nr:HAD family hydrolase [Acidimicrobiales bacterium]
MADPTAVLFDLDGTLTDTNYLHALAWRRAFLEAGEDVATARIHRMIGAGSDVLLRELVGEERDDVKEGWRRNFDALKGDVRAFPAAGDLLRAVAERGARVVLATSSEPDDVEVLRAAIDADDVVHAVTDAGDVEEAKPSPEVFERALQAAGADARSALVVGDTRWDVEAARAAGVDAVTLLCGGIGRAELEAAGAVAVFEDPADLLRRLDESPLARLWLSR